ncbi:MFS transporter [Eubacteriales bacterium OttesenSCG-928-N14]|nr:MFS transporter [Eubacteriales bacterium OttesenSCG-928-N14]
MNSNISTEDRRRKYLFCVTEFVFGLVAGSLVFNNAFMRVNGMTATQIGLVMTISSVLGMLAPPFWGAMADRLKSKFRVYMLTLALSACVAIFVPFTTGIQIAGIMLAGLLIPIVNFFRNPSYSVLDTISVSASEQVPGMDYSNVRVWQSIGFTTASYSYTPLMNMLIGAGWSYANSLPFFLFVAFAIICLCISGHLRQYEPKMEGKRKSTPLSQLQPGRIFKNYYLVAFIIINIIIHIPVNATQFLTFMFEEVGASNNMVGIATGARTTAEILMLFGAARIKKKLTLPGMIGLSTLLYVVEMSLYPMASAAWMLVAFDIIGGFGFGLALAAAINYIYLLAPKGLEATTVALYSAGNAVAGIVTNMVGGRLIDTLGARTFFTIAAVACAVSLGIYVLHFVFGEKVLKKTPPQTLFMRNNRSEQISVEQEPDLPPDESDVLNE